MSRRIDIELTAANPDGSWHWRAAGAREPRGVLEGYLLPAGAKLGDVLRAEMETDVDGLAITSVALPKAKRAEPERIEMMPPPLAPPRPVAPATPERDRSPSRAERPRRDGPPRDRRDGPPRDRRDGPPRERRDGPPRERRDRDRDAPAERRPARAAAERPPRPKPKRLHPGHTHRNAVLEALPPEQRAIAEQLLRGGIPALRQAVDAQNEARRAEGQPQIKADALVGAAEELLPRLRAAEWRDRADAAAADVEEIGLRDLRAVVASADAGARDDESRALAATLRAALDRRAEQERQSWTAEIGTALDEGRLIRALRIASRAPDPSTRLDSELATRLVDATGAAMAPDATTERWVALLDALAVSPFRRQVKPAGLPPEPTPELMAAAQKTAARIPAVAELLGIDVPPPPTGGNGPAGRPPRPDRRRKPGERRPAAAN